MEKEIKTGKSNRGNRPNPSNQAKIMKHSKGKGLEHYSFSYKIPSVNQFAVLANKWELDYIDIVIFLTIFNFIGSGIAKQIIEDGETWYWVADGLIIKYLPLLPLNSETSIIKRITNLCKYDLIERNPDNHKNGKKYLRIGNNAQLLFYTKKDN